MEDKNSGNRQGAVSRRRCVQAAGILPAAIVAHAIFPTTSVAAEELFAIRATAGANVGYSNLFVAQGAGTNRKYGLDAPVRLFDVGFLGTQATLAGQADLSGITEFPFIGLLARGGNLVAIAVDDQSYDLKLVVRSEIQTPTDLDGRKIGLIQGSTAQYAFDLYKNHFKLDKVKVLNIDAADQVVTMVKGEIDGFVWVEPVVANAFKILGSKIHILSPGLEAVYKTHLYLLMARAWAEKNRKHVENYLRALIEANEFIKSHSDEAAKIVSQKLNLPVELVPQYIKNAGFDWDVVWTKDSVVALDRAAEWMKANGRIKDIPNLRDAIDPSYLKAVRPDAVQL